MKQSVDLHKTVRIETTHLYQNHVNRLLSDIESYCDNYKGYRFNLLKPGPIRNTGQSVRKYLSKNQPKAFTISVSSTTGKGNLFINVSNGVSLSISDASYELYALGNIIESNLAGVRVPAGITFLRRYWLFNLVASIEFIPAVFMFAAGNSVGAISWLIIAPIVGVGAGAAAYSLSENFWDNLEWDDVILSTKIKYEHYSKRPGSSILATLSSTKVIVSVLASIATIGSFIFVIVKP